MSERLEFRYSPQRQLALFITGCALVAVSGLAATRSADIVYRTVGWFGVVFFTLCALIAVKRMINGGIAFAFELGGIAFHTGAFGLLPWTDIREYAVVSVKGNYFLALTFHDPARVLSRVSATKRRMAITNQRLGWGHWALSFSGLTPGLDEAVAFIREHPQLHSAG
jgi:hypothetical protein